MKIFHSLWPRLSVLLIGLALCGGDAWARDKRDDHKKKDSEKSQHSSSGHGSSHSPQFKRGSGESPAHHEAPRVVQHSPSPGRVDHGPHKSHNDSRSNVAHSVTHHSPSIEKRGHSPVRSGNDARSRIAQLPQHHSSHLEHRSDVSPRTAHSAPRVTHSSSHLDRDRVEHHSVTHRSSSGHEHHAGFVEHNAHHSAEWYRSNGWHHDNDYWRRHHHHRFYDNSGCVIFESSVEPYYAYDFDPYPQSQVYVERAPLYENSGVDYQTRVEIQEELSRAGYYDGDVDGIIGPGTRRAIADFQRDNDLRPTGLINTALLEALGIR